MISACGPSSTLENEFSSRDLARLSRQPNIRILLELEMIYTQKAEARKQRTSLAVDPRNEARSDLARLKSRSSSTWKRTRRINLSAISADFVTWSARRGIDSLSDFKVQVRGYGSESRRPLLFHSKFHSGLGIPTPRAKVRRDPLAGSDCSS